ncbi:hypothetical protein [Bacillus suaedaesalsae]|uniref:Uncharacterized protein n=1 Tax=Bacillus suaedaesalsae TaxID=2810349 RepID=A0ABS2DL65_9BACI|nr:hypothetical protein [Bacillus suaedaesalsae]MBM6619137.1 hypothetical protein [Bacillus suaedaesalsae]
MVKSFKGKVVTGVVAVGLLSGVSMAFANTDAGTGLKAWYDVQFGKSAASVQKQTTDYAASKVPALAREYNGLKSDATNSINSTRDSEITNTASDIESAKQGHVDALNAKEAEIAGYMASQFDGISVYANSVINSVGTQAYNYAQADLGRHTGSKGQAALTKVNDDLTATTNAAVTELEAEIASAKAALQAQLATETATTVEEIKAATDAKIAELRELITAKKNELVATQQGLITAKAQELEDAAKADLDALVLSINN